MHIDFFLQKFEVFSKRDAIIWRDNVFNYAYLSKKIRFWRQYLVKHKISTGSAVGLEGDFSPNSIAALFALIEQKCIVVPLSYSQKYTNKQKYEIAMLDFLICFNEKDMDNLVHLGKNSNHPLYLQLKKNDLPGLVLFTSGTSGKPKAALHDFSALLKKFKTARESLKTLNFLLFDHWGGLNTMFHTLSNGGVVITLEDRSPENICKMIENYKIELLPASPTFLNLLIISKAYENYSLSSLKIISYGTEPMTQATLDKMNTIFPTVKLKQTYGLIEVGVLRTDTKNNNSLFIKVGGEGYLTRIIDGILQIKSESTMLGYLNAPSPFTADGWFNTNDVVEIDGEYIRVLGRQSEIINVGGEKVYPAEIESVIQELDEVIESQVYAEKNPIIGNIVCAKVCTKIKIDDEKKLILTIKKHCAHKLEKFKVPVKIFIVDKIEHSARFKKIRQV